jgi:hypothetical protein
LKAGELLLGPIFNPAHTQSKRIRMPVNIPQLEIVLSSMEGQRAEAEQNAELARQQIAVLDLYIANLSMAIEKLKQEQEE